MFWANRGIPADHQLSGFLQPTHARPFGPVPTEAPEAGCHGDTEHLKVPQVSNRSYDICRCPNILLSLMSVIFLAHHSVYIPMSLPSATSARLGQTISSETGRNQAVMAVWPIRLGGAFTVALLATVLHKLVILESETFSRYLSNYLAFSCASHHPQAIRQSDVTTHMPIPHIYCPPPERLSPCSFPNQVPGLQYAPR